MCVDCREYYRNDDGLYPLTKPKQGGGGAKIVRISSFFADVRLTKALVASADGSDEDNGPRKTDVPGLQTGRPSIAFDLLRLLVR